MKDCKCHRKKNHQWNIEVIRLSNYYISFKLYFSPSPTKAAFRGRLDKPSPAYFMFQPIGGFVLSFLVSGCTQTGRLAGLVPERPARQAIIVVAQNKVVGVIQAVYKMSSLQVSAATRYHKAGGATWKGYDSFTVYGLWSGVASFFLLFNIWYLSQSRIQNEIKKKKNLNWRCRTKCDTFNTSLCI